MYKPKFLKPKITPAFKKRILKDWHVYFPSLTIDPPLCLTRRVGPLLIYIGFDIKSGRDYYYPGFGVHNLCRPFDVLTRALSTDLEGSPSHFSVWGHEEGRYIEAAERLRKQAPLPIEGPISLSMIIQAYKNYVKEKGSQTISLMQDPALIAAWAGQQSVAKEALQWGYEEFAQWEPEWREDYGGLEGWHKDMKEKIADPEKLQSIAEEQVIFHKLEHIPMEELPVD